jgi:hypothetical protein
MPGSSAPSSDEGSEDDGGSEDDSSVPPFSLSRPSERVDDRSARPEGLVGRSPPSVGERPTVVAVRAL